ncbi:hypothetical protein GOP47_0000052 [Adiantum capillus-veneris]|uniref:MBD domain-containing protein n=1 Tax=Adiantum capillus-veneris TaxID=13818 RepID=A0A9D4VE69_ADICA|nr:hypothetical protein GOP47_0000052 [Adiantum capillus-veneris]
MNKLISHSYGTRTPESKRLPLLHIHGRRLSTKNYGNCSPETISHASSPAFTKTESTNITTAPPTAHRRMYSDDHQAAYHDKPVELATTLWPPETTNYWFPNWKELFHGFLVVQKGQPSHALVTDSEQRGRGVCIQEQKSGCPPQCSSSQPVHLGPNNANTSIHWAPFSQESQQHHLWTYTNAYQQKRGSRPQSSSTQSVHFGSINNANTSTHHIPSSQQSQHHHLQMYSNDKTQEPLHILPVMRQAKDQAQIAEANKASSSLIRAPGIITKRSIRSPFWLPQGWITEIHIRRTGTTAGTRDKYFKHLTSGRTFRTRKDVLHFTSTGKGRARKKSRGHKPLMYSAGHSLLKTFAHEKLSILEDLLPYTQSCCENKHSTHAASSLVLGLSGPELNDGSGPLCSGLPCKQLDSLGSSSSIQSPVKEYAKEKSHKLPVTKKARILPSKVGEDKPASKLLQWLTKPVPIDDNTPLSKDNTLALTVSFTGPDAEKAATEVADERSTKDLSWRVQTAHRAIQLSKQIQAAHNDVVQMSREMQATAEKLSQEILVAKKDADLDREMQVSHAPIETIVVLADNAEVSKGCKTQIETSSRSLVASSVDNEVSKPGEAISKLPNPAHFPSFANNHGNCGASGSDCTSGVSKVLLHAATSMPETGSSSLLPVNKPPTWPNVIEHPKVQMVKAACAPMEAETAVAKMYKDLFNHGKQPAQTALVETLQKHATPAVLIPHRTERSPVSKEDVTQPALWPEVPTHILLPITSGNVAKAVDVCASTYYEVAQPVNAITASTHVTRSHVLVNNHYWKQPDEVTEANDAEGLFPMDHLGQVPVIEQAPNGIYTATTEKLGIVSYEAQRGAYSALESGMQETSDRRQNVNLQAIGEIEARRLRRQKFSAVLNPTLDLSRLSPSLTTRQKAKVVEKMKARHARELLATLGKHICRKAVRRKS